MIPVGGLTHYLGDAVALVAAEDMGTVERAKKLIRVEYEVLPAVHSIEEAAAPHAPRVFDEEESNVQAYKHVSRGNADEAIRNAGMYLHSILRRRGRNMHFLSRNAPWHI